MVDLFRELRPASFRGIPFMVESDEKVFGRSVITHEFPGRDDPGHEDMGAKPDRFSIEVIIGGENFIADALAFEDALKQKGPATLIHPYYGEITVIVVGDVRRRHSSNTVGEVAFSVPMEKYSPVSAPMAASNTADGLRVASDAGFAAALSDFTRQFRNSGIPDFVSADSINRNTLFTDGLNTALSRAGIAQSFPVLDVLKGDYAQSAIDAYKTIMDLAAPRKTPVIGQAVTSTPADGQSVLNALNRAADQSVLDTIPATTASRSIRAQNAQALDYFNRLSTLSAATGSVRYMTFESREEAAAVRDQLGTNLSTLRDQVGAAGWDDSYRAIADMQGAVNRDISVRIGRLPRTIRIRPTSVRSSLSLANRLYGDNPADLLNKASDLASRNTVRHPGFVPADNLEVLIDAN